MSDRAPPGFRLAPRFTAALIAEFQQGHQAVRRKVDKFKARLVKHSVFDGPDPSHFCPGLDDLTNLGQGQLDLQDGVDGDRTIDQDSAPPWRDIPRQSTIIFLVVRPSGFRGEVEQDLILRFDPDLSPSILSDFFPRFGHVASVPGPLKRAGYFL